MPKPSSKPPTNRNTNTAKKNHKVAAAKHTTHVTNKLPGYWRFSQEVWSILWIYRPIFLKLVVVTVVTLAVVSFAAEREQYSNLSEATYEAVKELPDSGMRAVVATGVLFSSLLSGSLSSVLEEQQHIYRAAVLGFFWLVTVWLLRHLLTGTAVKLRDGLYGAGAPLVSTFLVMLAGAIQLLPLALTVSLFAALLTTGVLSQTIVILLLGMASIALTVLTIYWLTGTLFAAVIVTIPGTYPLAALRSGRKLVAGYRVALLLRFLWLVLVLFLVYAAVMLPFLYLDAATGIASPAFVVLLSQLFGVISLLYAFSYIYLLYRKMIDGRSE